MRVQRAYYQQDHLFFHVLFVTGNQFVSDKSYKFCSNYKAVGIGIFEVDQQIGVTTTESSTAIYLYQYQIYVAMTITIKSLKNNICYHKSVTGFIQSGHRNFNNPFYVWILYEKVQLMTTRLQHFVVIKTIQSYSCYVKCTHLQKNY